MGLCGRHRAPSAACYIQSVLPASLSSGLGTLCTSFSAKQSIVRCVITGLKNVQTAQNGKPRKNSKERFYLATGGHSHGYTTFLQASLACYLYQSRVPCLLFFYLCRSLLNCFSIVFISWLISNVLLIKYIIYLYLNIVFSQACFKIEVPTSVLCSFAYSWIFCVSIGVRFTCRYKCMSMCFCACALDWIDS